jgi:hypothetical protein
MPVLFSRESRTTVRSEWTVVVVRANATPRSNPFCQPSWATTFPAQAQEGVWYVRTRHARVGCGPVMFFGLFKQWTVDFFLFSAEVREAQQGKSRPKLWTGLGRGSAVVRDGPWPNSHSGLFFDVWTVRKLIFLYVLSIVLICKEISS